MQGSWAAFCGQADAGRGVDLVMVSGRCYGGPVVRGNASGGGEESADRGSYGLANALTNCYPDPIEGDKNKYLCYMSS